MVEHKFYCTGMNETYTGVVAIVEHHGKPVRTKLVEIIHK